MHNNSRMITGSRPTQKREVERRRKMHLEKLRKMGPTSQSNAKKLMDMDEPEVFPHLLRNLKKERMKKELLQKTERENLLLMAKIYGIMNIDAKEAGRAYAPGIRLDAHMRPTLDCHNNGDVWLPGQAVLNIKPINGKAREREYQRQVEENLKMTKLLRGSKPTYSKATFEDHWSKAEGYRGNIQRNNTAGYLGIDGPPLSSPLKRGLRSSPSPLRGTGASAAHHLRSSREMASPLKTSQSSPALRGGEEPDGVSPGVLEQKIPEMSFVHRCQLETTYGGVADLLVSNLTQMNEKHGIFIMVKDDSFGGTGFRFLSVQSLMSVCEPQTSSVLLLADSIPQPSIETLLSPPQQDSFFEDLCSKCVINRNKEALSIDFLKPY
mmetsp:Transcript_26133/g.34336  ORF Transcript_26133/g.34336 Transcript_26133/m.34336 type:complete len:380 (+) Transcript_26133:44-1183(+)